MDKRNVNRYSLRNIRRNKTKLNPKHAYPSSQNTSKKAKRQRISNNISETVLNIVDQGYTKLSESRAAECIPPNQDQRDNYTLPNLPTRLDVPRNIEESTEPSDIAGDEDCSSNDELMIDTDYEDGPCICTCSRAEFNGHNFAHYNTAENTPESNTANEATLPAMQEGSNFVERNGQNEIQNQYPEVHEEQNVRPAEQNVTRAVQNVPLTGQNVRPAGQNVEPVEQNVSSVRQDATPEEQGPEEFYEVSEEIDFPSGIGTRHSGLIHDVTTNKLYLAIPLPTLPIRPIRFQRRRNFVSTITRTARFVEEEQHVIEPASGGQGSLLVDRMREVDGMRLQLQVSEVDRPHEAEIGRGPYQLHESVENVGDENRGDRSVNNVSNAVQNGVGNGNQRVVAGLTPVPLAPVPRNGQPRPVGANARRKEKKIEEKCAICLRKIQYQDIGILDTCRHIFCYQCIKRWSEKSRTCPIDRKRYHRILLQSWVTT